MIKAIKVRRSASQTQLMLFLTAKVLFSCCRFNITSMSSMTAQSYVRERQIARQFIGRLIKALKFIEFHYLSVKLCVI